MGSTYSAGTFLQFPPEMITCSKLVLGGGIIFGARLRVVRSSFPETLRWNPYPSAVPQALRYTIPSEAVNCPSIDAFLAG